MAEFASTEELFGAVRDLTARLEAAGQRAAAAQLREGFACLNGLTDGWAQLLEAVDRVEARAAAYAVADRQALARLRRELVRIVYGARPGCLTGAWWRRRGSAPR